MQLPVEGACGGAGAGVRDHVECEAEGEGVAAVGVLELQDGSVVTGGGAAEGVKRLLGEHLSPLFDHRLTGH